MTEWTKTFKELSETPPKLNRLPAGVASEFWEMVYDAFRDRLIYEINEGEPSTLTLSDAIKALYDAAQERVQDRQEQK